MVGRDTPGPKPRVPRAKVLALREKGLSYAQIGERLGISKQRAHQIDRAEREKGAGDGQ